MSISVAEHFYTVQGEGPYAGTPAVFLRLAGCNLQCGLAEDDALDDFEAGQEPTADGATWICDTIDVWREASDMPSASELAAEWEAKGWADNVDSGAHIVLTGGEPTLPAHQNTVPEFFNELGGDSFVEVETNGTIIPTGEFKDHVDHFNVSLKLSNSGMAAEDRLNKEAIQFYRDLDADDSQQDAIFKFVVSSHNDVAEVKDIQDEYNIPDSQMSLMPAGQTKADMGERYPKVVELCKDNGWRFSPRLQVETWGQVTGV